MGDVVGAIDSARWLERAVDSVLEAPDEAGAVSAAIDACAALPCERLWIGFCSEGGKLVPLGSWSRDGNPVTSVDAACLARAGHEPPGEATVFPLARPAGGEPGYLAMYGAALDGIQASHVAVLDRVLSVVLDPTALARARRERSGRGQIGRAHV